MGKNFLDSDGMLYKRKPRTKTFTIPLERTKIKIDYYTDTELHAAKNEVLVFDLEIYPNYFLAAFQHYRTKKVVTFDLFPGREVFNYQKLLWVLHNFCIIGFNSLRFDLPLMWLAMTGATVDVIHDACMSIIVGNARARDIESQYGFRQSQINHIDLIEVAPLSASLKTYMGRLHAKRLQDLPYDPMKDLKEEESNNVKHYCVNDLDGTLLLLNDLNPQLSLRSSMGDQYGQDLRSKSDAQIAETVICSEVAKLNGRWPKRVSIQAGTILNYTAPEFINFKADNLTELLNTINNANYVVSNSSQRAFDMPPELLKRKIVINNTEYSLGLGGLHSTEKSIKFCSDESGFLIEPDVSSFYPRTILNLELFPTQLTENFLPVFESIVETRLSAKATSKSIEAEIDELLGNCSEELKLELTTAVTEMNSKKVTINGSFGKFGSKYSLLYAPSLMISITLTGQLALLMLIEEAESIGIQSLSANTDGIVFKCPQNAEGALKKVINEWEDATGYTMDDTRYSAIYKRDVNNFIGVKTNGKLKIKGTYRKADLSKNPTNTVCTEAITELITKNIPIEETIRNCKDITKFVTLRNVRGGGEKDGIYLGKVVRWYYAEKEYGTINYVNSGNKVPKSDGAKPVMDLPDEFPTDINYKRYIDETIGILYDIGYLKKPTQRKFFD